MVLGAPVEEIFAFISDVLVPKTVTVCVTAPVMFDSNIREIVICVKWVRG